jgi:hypothetical protein
MKGKVAFRFTRDPTGHGLCECQPGRIARRQLQPLDRDKLQRLRCVPQRGAPCAHHLRPPVAPSASRRHAGGLPGGLCCRQDLQHDSMAGGGSAGERSTPLPPFVLLSYLMRNDNSQDRLGTNSTKNSPKHFQMKDDCVSCRTTPRQRRGSATSLRAAHRHPTPVATAPTGAWKSRIASAWRPASRSLRPSLNCLER